MHIPGIGPVTAGAVVAFAPDLDMIDSRRTFPVSRWKHAFGVTPRQRSTGGKCRSGSIGKTGQADIRRPLIVGASHQRRAFRATSVVRWVVFKCGRPNRWLAAVFARLQRRVAAPPMSRGPLAIQCRPRADRMARTARTLPRNGTCYMRHGPPETLGNLRYWARWEVG